MPGGDKTFLALTALPAADVNEYLMRQAIARVTSATRPTGAEGRHIDESDTDRFLRYDGANWRQIGHAEQRASRTAGDVSLNSTTPANVDTGTDITLKAVAGDVILAGISLVFSNEAVSANLDIMTTAGSNYLGPGLVGAAGGMSGLVAVGAAAFEGKHDSVLYTTVSGDISAGNVVLRARYKTGTAAVKTLRATANQPFLMWAVNLGPDVG